MRLELVYRGPLRWIALEQVYNDIYQLIAEMPNFDIGKVVLPQFPPWKAIVR